MSVYVMAMIAVGGVALVVSVVWLLGWGERPPMDSLEEAQAVVDEEFDGTVDWREALLGDDGLTALLVGHSSGVYLVHTVGAHRNALHLAGNVEKVIQDDEQLVIRTSSFDTPQVSIRIADDALRRSWADRIDAAA